jgi:hypothetical protein
VSALGAVRAGRRAAEALMADTCTISRGGGSTVFDPDTGEYVTTVGEAIYTGACRVKPRDNADQVVEAGGTNVSLFPYVVSVPVGAVAYEVDDLVTVTAGALDPALVGLVLRVRQISVGTHLTARRLGCEVDAG